MLDKQQLEENSWQAHLATKLKSLEASLLENDARKDSKQKMKKTQLSQGFAS